MFSRAQLNEPLKYQFFEANLNGAGGTRTHVQTHFPMNFIGYGYVLYIRFLDKRTKARRLTEDLTRKGQ